MRWLAATVDSIYPCDDVLRGNIVLHLMSRGHDVPAALSQHVDEIPYVRRDLLRNGLREELLDIHCSPERDSIAEPLFE